MCLLASQPPPKHATELHSRVVPLLRCPPPPPRMECVGGEWEPVEAVQWGRGMGGWWLGWIHTHPNHLPVLCRTFKPQTRWEYTSGLSYERDPGVPSLTS